LADRLEQVDVVGPNEVLCHSDNSVGEGLLAVVVGGHFADVAGKLGNLETGVGVE